MDRTGDVARDLVRRWANADLVPCGELHGEQVVLAFADRRLVGVLLLAVRDGLIYRCTMYT